MKHIVYTWLDLSHWPLLNDSDLIAVKLHLFIDQQMVQQKNFHAGSQNAIAYKSLTSIYHAYKCYLAGHVPNTTKYYVVMIEYI